LCDRCIAVQTSPLHLFFTTPATPEIYPLSLHDALPIFACLASRAAESISSNMSRSLLLAAPSVPRPSRMPSASMAATGASNNDRSEEHTSELQSLAYLVCRLLLEKKKQHRTSSVSMTTF